ncbi:hypothetical protein SAMN05216456_1338 [Devosia crocina]|uniref:DUF1643 domain-containing protein n=1 Tax=Devosia crocina TaxID=429728 RepID=A0A1I7N9V3_9HYPH|nr:DUF1643 domain-containing protein [Devosia crocina]SFV31428.1 hypothetical protein SAMN05216456_1338 [Devosia crocina]
MNDLFTPVADPATFSPCRTWRYRLERRWGDGAQVAFIMLNPSTADEENNDPTIRRCISYAKHWGFGGLLIGNIFAFRSTDPKGLYSAPDPIGPENDDWLDTIANQAAAIVCGWGVHGAYQARGRAVLDRLSHRKPMALKLTADGHPGHPLYLRKDLEPEPIQ